jgi:hypothetical protein
MPAFRFLKHSNPLFTGLRVMFQVLPIMKRELVWLKRHTPYVPAEPQPPRRWCSKGQSERLLHVQVRRPFLDLGRHMGVAARGDPAHAAAFDAEFVGESKPVLWFAT